MSCWIAEQNFIYVRPCLSLLDFVFAIVFAAVVGSIVGGLAWTFNPIRNDVTTLWSVQLEIINEALWLVSESHVMSYDQS